MIITKEQMILCEKMEKKGGPKSYGGAMLYHQYQSQKKQVIAEKKVDKENVKDQLIQKVQEIQILEKEIKKKQKQVKEEKNELQMLFKIIE